MLNKIILQGRLTGDVELRQTHGGTNVASATLAVRRSRKDNTTGAYQTDFIDCVFWGKTAEVAARWFGKGDMAIVTGRLESRDWEDKNGNKRRSWEVQAETLDFCGGKNDGAGSGARSASAAVENDDFTEYDDGGELPF